MNGAEIKMIMLFAEAVTSEEKTDRIMQLQFSALQELQGQLRYYEKRGYSNKLIEAIAEKKGRMILQTTNKAEMEKILHPDNPHYNGVEFVAAPMSVPEEELICWSEASLRAPLNSAGNRRYMTLFKQFFPNESEDLQ